MAYKRVLLKISGEQLAGKFDVGIDTEIVSFMAEEVKKATESGCQMIIVAGGGNMVRGAELAGNGIKRVTADHMGMLSGLMNAMAMTDIFEEHKLGTRCMSNIFADQVAESYSYRRAEKHLEEGLILIIAGGLGRPYFTHDTAAVNMALELECDVVLKATKVDGVYSEDPTKNDKATRYEELSYQQAVENNAIQVMDKAAMGLAMEQNMPLIIFSMGQPDTLLKICQGEHIGTIIS